MIWGVSAFVTDQLPEESSYKDKDTDWKELTRPDTPVMANRMWVMGISLIMVEGGGRCEASVEHTYHPGYLDEWEYGLVKGLTFPLGET